MPQNSHPMGLAGRREAIRAPTVGHASESRAVEIASIGPGLSGGIRNAGVMAPRNRPERIRATQTPHRVHASRPAGLASATDITGVPPLPAAMPFTLASRLPGCFYGPSQPIV